MIDRITVLHFSPTGGTRRAAQLLAARIAQQVEEIDLALPQAQTHGFGPEDVVLVAGPVYGGRPAQDRRGALHHLYALRAGMPDRGACAACTCAGDAQPEARAVCRKACGKRAVHLRIWQKAALGQPFALENEKEKKRNGGKYQNEKGAYPLTMSR